MDLTLDEIKQVYAETNSLRLTAKRFGIGRTKLTTFLKKNGIKINSSKQAKRRQFKFRYFQSINTEKKAYWFGFLLADGYINESSYLLRIELQEKDREHLDNFRLDIGAKNHKLNERVSRNSVWLSLNGKELAEDLKLQGMYQGKSETLGFPTTVPSELMRHFLRGYFDGDGSIYHQGKKSAGIGIIGTDTFLEEFRKIVLSNTLIGKMRLRKVSTTSKMYRLEIYNVSDTLKLASWLYDNSHVKLKRKFNKYKSIKKKLQRL